MRAEMNTSHPSAPALDFSIFALGDKEPVGVGPSRRLLEIEDDGTAVRYIERDHETWVVLAEWVETDVNR